LGFAYVVKDFMDLGRKTLSKTFVAVIALGFIAVFQAGCAIRLGPDYDKAIFDGLTKINEDAMTLFASVASGASKNTYPKRQPVYDGLIGKLDAVRVQIDARLSPSPPLLLTTMLSQNTNATPPTSDAKSRTPAVPEVPSLGSVNTMIRTITSMRDQDSKWGLTSNLVSGFKLRFEPSIEQALVYEKALNR
jgi:hypothetical protein